MNPVDGGALDRSWRATCRTLLGDEIGPMSDYGDWLGSLNDHVTSRKSAISGKDVYLAAPHYAKGSRFISLDEVDFSKTFPPLDINEIKDIESILESIRERLFYCGDIVLGNSKDVVRSSDIQNSFNVIDSNFVYDSEYVAYSSYIRGSKYLFGAISDYGCSMLVRTFETHKQSRCFEAWKCYDSSDIYFSACVQGSQDVLFSFNQRNKKNMVGNLELPRDKYLALKKKLIGELRDELVRNKKLPSLMEMVSSSAALQLIPKRMFAEAGRETGDMAPIEEAFQKTTSVLFGRPLHGFESYGEWLMEYIPPVEEQISVASGKRMWVGDVNPCKYFPRDRLVDMDEYWDLGKITRLDSPEIGSLDSLKKSIGKIAFLNPNGRLGECKNVTRSPLVNTSMNIYNCPIASFDENTAYSYWPRSSKYIFGSALAFDSSFCIRSFYSANLSRVFEVDGSNGCSDAYYLHNCENARDSMFCFNAKNLRYSIGNSQLARDDYKRVKTLLLGQIADELERKKKLPYGIYTIGEGV